MLHKLVALSALIALTVATNEAGEKFLAENAKRDEVTVLPSGLQYRKIRAGEGKAHPLVGTSCKCHYEGRTATNYPDGSTFDSSYKRGEPISFAPNQVIGGWTEAMQLMVQGDKWELFIPSDLGYGDRGAGADIGPGDALIFTIEIIEINGEAKPISDEL